MPYTPDNPYIPGDPYSYDLKWIVTQIQTCLDNYESALTTPVNARGEYYNTYYHWSQNFKLDQTENMILYYMA